MQDGWSREIIWKAPVQQALQAGNKRTQDSQLLPRLVETSSRVHNV